MLVGYARVSTGSQSYELQRDELLAAGCDKDSIFCENKSGAKRDKRTALRRAIDRLDQGDTLVVTKVDRLARSSRDLANILYEVEEAGAKFKSLWDPLYNSDSPTSVLVRQILASVAEFERKLIDARCTEGRDRTRTPDDKGRVVHFGPHFAMTPTARLEALKMKTDGKSLREIADMFGVSRSTISRIVSEPVEYLPSRARKAGYRGVHA